MYIMCNITIVVHTGSGIVSAPLRALYNQDTVTVL